MLKRGRVVLLLMSVSACGGNDSPTAPTATANIVVPSGAGLSLPGCDAEIRLGQNLGSHRAARVRGR